MREIHLEEMKKIELDILIYIDQVCKENNLRYSLCGGTLLGAIRHAGFIPWDDDIDIMMPRPDYDKLIAILSHTDSKYKILSPTQNGYYYNFSKVIDSKTSVNEYHYQPIDNMGIYIDIFPLEGMPSVSRLRDKHFNKLHKLRKRINSFSLLKPKIRKNLLKYFKSLFLYLKNKKTHLAKLQKQYDTLAHLYNYDDCDFVYMSGGAYPKIEMFLKENMNVYETHIFEQREFQIIKEYDLYLTQLYRDYMKLPPKEKQITHHHFTAKYKCEKTEEEKQ